VRPARWLELPATRGLASEELKTSRTRHKTSLTLLLLFYIMAIQIWKISQDMSLALSWSMSMSPYSAVEYLLCHTSPGTLTANFVLLS
jgi:hypothetical protein